MEQRNIKIIDELDKEVTIKEVRWYLYDRYEPYRPEPGTKGGISFGDAVRIRPLGEMNPEGETYTGVYIGEFTVSKPTLFLVDDSILEICPTFKNPGFLVPDLGRVVFGIESYWSRVEDPRDRRAITEKTIDSTWYIQALRQYKNAAQQ